jgi:uncharacterized protein (DUF58 family)
MRRLSAALLGGALVVGLLGASPAIAAPTVLTVQASVVDQQCQGGDFVLVTLAANAESSSQARFAWDFTNNGSFDMKTSNTTVTHLYMDEVTVTARVGAQNREGDRAFDTVTFGTLRCE